MSRVIRKSLVVLAVVAAIAATTAWVQIDRFLKTPVNVGESGEVFDVRSGMAFRQISEGLAAEGIVKRPTLLRLYARWTGKAGRIQAGEYQIAAGTTPIQLIDMFVRGAVQLYSFTIVEGWTYRELLQALADDEIIEKSIEYEDWPALLQNLNADANHPEGLFLPETYRVPKGTSDVELLEQAFDLMQTTLSEEWAGRATELPFANPYEALVLASIIEKETALATERPRISGVFVRRLQSGMRLQTDPTVIYGIGTEFDGNLTRRHMRTDTPYNTYTRSGLPPTPIALAGRAAINAALHPADGNELFFVATGLGDGSHQFSATKDEHDAAVQQYLARQRAARTP